MSPVWTLCCLARIVPGRTHRCREEQGEGETGNRSRGWPGPCAGAAPRGLFGPSLGLTPTGLVALRLRENSLPANFSNLSAFRAKFWSDTGTRETKKATRRWLCLFGAPERIRTSGPQIRKV